MKKTILFLMLLIPTTLHAEEGVDIIAGFEKDSDLPVLNNTIRKLDEKSQDIDTRVETLEGGVVQSSTQAEMETATSTTTYVSPGRTKYHPGVAKAWCQFDGTTVGTNAPTVGYNVTSVQRHSGGLYTINFTTAMSSVNYVPTGTVTGVTAAIGVVTVVSAANQAVGSCQITTRRTLDESLVDFERVNVVFYGDQ